MGSLSIRDKTIHWFKTDSILMCSALSLKRFSKDAEAIDGFRKVDHGARTASANMIHNHLDAQQYTDLLCYNKLIYPLTFLRSGR